MRTYLSGFVVAMDPEQRRLHVETAHPYGADLYFTPVQWDRAERMNNGLDLVLGTRIELDAKPDGSGWFRRPEGTWCQIEKITGRFDTDVPGRTLSGRAKIKRPDEGGAL